MRSGGCSCWVIHHQAWRVTRHQAWQVTRHQAWRVTRHQAWRVTRHQAWRVTCHQVWRVTRHQAWQVTRHLPVWCMMLHASHAAASCFLLHQWWAFLTPSLTGEIGVNTKHARKPSIQANRLWVDVGGPIHLTKHACVGPLAYCRAPGPLS